MGSKTGLEVIGPRVAGEEAILTPEALAFVEGLVRPLRPRIAARLEARAALQARLDAGERLDFLSETAEIRAGAWEIAPVPAGLQRRTVEITGPTDRKMMIHALNSGADLFMADLEDSTAPSWRNVVEGQVNLLDAAQGKIEYHHAERGETYRLKGSPAGLLVRPRGLHLPERHVRLDGEAIPGALFDFGMFVFHSGRVLAEAGRGPWLYLPKLEHHLEARIWNDAFLWAQEALGLPRGTIKATVLIETLPAAFQMDEILYELREHSAGLNCGRWDYIFSFIKKQRADAGAVLPDRAQVTMAQPFMRAYTQLVVKTCHKRGAHAMGGMAAQIPIKNDPAAHEAAMGKVRADKLREVQDGHDGTWVAHPGLVALAREVFEAHMTGPNQLGRLREDVEVTAQDLLAIPQGTRTRAGLRWNLRVGVQYVEAWLRGQGCVPLYHLMEDAATAEISRAQVWQWCKHAATLDDGATVTPALIAQDLDEQLAQVRAELGGARYEAGRFGEARALFYELTVAEALADFLTVPAYERLTRDDAQ
jgi:malate synthase